MTIRTITIYDNIRAVYIAIPKTGNTSIKAQLHYLNCGAMLDNPHAEAAPIKILKPSDITSAVRCKNLVFTFVRNPWERLLSVWADKCGPNTDISLLPWGIEPGITFESFVNRVACIPDESADVHFQSQSHLTFHSGLFLPSFVSRFESFKEDWLRIVSLLTLDRARVHRELPHLRQSDHGPYRDYYSPAMANKVGGRYEADAKIFGYKY